MTDRIDEYLELAQKRTPDELTEEEEAALNGLAADDQAEHHTLAPALFRKLVRSYSKMRGEYEASNVREHLALDQNERLRAQLEEKANRQIMILRIGNWCGAVELLEQVKLSLGEEVGNTDHPPGMQAWIGRWHADVEKVFGLLTKVDDGLDEHRDQLRREHATKPSYNAIVCYPVPGWDSSTDPHEPERQKRKLQLDVLTEVRGLLEHGHARENVLEALARMNALGDELGRELG